MLSRSLASLAAGRPALLSRLSSLPSMSPVSVVAPSSAEARRGKHSSSSGTSGHSASVPAAGSLSSKSDKEVLELLIAGKVRLHLLENELNDCVRALELRRQFYKHHMDAIEQTKPMRPGHLRSAGFAGLPLSNFNSEPFFRSVHGRNCESVVGFMPVPVGMVGPLLLDEELYMVPLATTEGALVASTNRGCRAIRDSGGATSIVTSDGMTRAPVLRLPSLADVSKLTSWMQAPENFAKIEAAFNSTSNFAKLLDVTCHSAGRNVYLRFRCSTGDAMGMNMISKGVSVALNIVQSVVPGMRVISLSGNFCTDKKPSAINWLQGRGKRCVL
jgi:hydroxymethylglutaryl-CoA reductase (NADPH)